MADLSTGGTTTLTAPTGSVDVTVMFWHVTLVRPSAVPTTTAVLVLTLSTPQLSSSVRVQVSASPTFDTLLKDEVMIDVLGDGSTQRSTMQTGLSDATTYHWRARAEPATYDPAGWSVGMFRVSGITGAEHVYLSVNLGWGVQPSPDAFAYHTANLGIRNATTGVGAAYVWENIGVVYGNKNSGGEYLFQTVTAAAPSPHLWFLSPAQGRPGTGFDLVGFGMGDLQATYGGAVEWYDEENAEWVGVPIVSWQTFPPRAAAYTDSREMHTAGVVPPRDIYTFHTTFDVPGLLGSPWRLDGGSWTVTDNVVGPAAGGSGIRLASIPSLVDGSVSIRLASLNALIAFRALDNANFLYFNPETRFFRQVVSGVEANVGSVRPLPTITSTHRQRSDGFATITFAVPHDVQVGDTVNITGMGSTPFHGTHVVSGVTATTVSYPLAGTEGAAAATGTLSRNNRLGDQYTVSFSGNTLSVQRNSASMGSVSSGTHNTRTRVGIAATSGTERVRQFTWLSGDDPTTPIDMQHTRIGVLVPAGALPPGVRIRVRTEG